jgi:hypothetical protein
MARARHTTQDRTVVPHRRAPATAPSTIASPFPSRSPPTKIAATSSESTPQIVRLYVRTFWSGSERHVATSTPFGVTTTRAPRRRAPVRVRPRRETEPRDSVRVRRFHDLSAPDARLRRLRARSPLFLPAKDGVVTRCIVRTNATICSNDRTSCTKYRTEVASRKDISSKPTSSKWRSIDVSA